MFLKLLVTALLAVVTSNIVASVKLDPNFGSNWYVPIATSSSTPLAAASSSGDAAAPSYNYNTVLNTGQNGQSSFLPTSGFLSVNQPATASMESNNQALYYHTNLQQHQSPPTGGLVGKQYQYLQYNPEGNSYNIYPVAQTPDSADAEQRQEFLDGGPEGGEGGSIFDNLPSVGGITSGITGTASNIAQSIGLGSFGFFGSLIVLAVLGPLIVLAILFPAVILAVSILAFPVVQLTLPPSDPNLGRLFKSGVMDTARKAKEILQSEECVERFSCLLARKSRTLPYENWILGKMDTLSNNWANRVSKSVKSGRAGEDCQRFKCAPVTKMKDAYNALTSSTAKYLRQSS